MANKVYNMAGGLHSAAAYSALEDAMYGSSVATSADFVATAGTGMNVSLSAGNGLISTGSGYARRIASDAVNTIAISAAASSDRIDSIVAYIDNSVTPTTSLVDNTNGILNFVAVAGTPAATPTAPSAATIQTAVGAGNPYMVLWEVKIPANATSLTTATFTDKRVIASLLSILRGNQVVKRTVLWEVTGSASTGNTFALADNAGNFDQLEIFHTLGNSTEFKGTAVSIFDLPTSGISIVSPAGASDTAWTVMYSRFNLSGTTMTRSTPNWRKIIGSTTVQTSSGTDDKVAIWKIVGIKYITI